MTIEEFSRVSGLNRATIYFYIKGGFICPVKKKRYVFDDRCLSDARLIELYKSFGFGLPVIKKLLNLRKILGRSDRLLRKYQIALLEKKLSELEQLKSQLELNLLSDDQPQS